MFPRFSECLGAVLALAALPVAANEVGASEGCDLELEPESQFVSSQPLSSPLAAAFMPSIAARDRRVLIAWQETDRRANYVAYTVVVDGCIGPVRYVEDSLPNPRRPAVAATSSGWVLAYEAQDPPEPLIRSVRLDPSGEPLAAPETVSAPGAVASRVRVAALGEDVVYAWSDVLGHQLARRGPVEKLPPTAVGVRIEAPGLINYPRIALDEEGTIYLAYRDGGPERTDYEIQLVTRRVGESFSPPVNISKSRGLMSDDVAIVAERDGRIRLAWAEQDAERPEAFEVVHVTLDGGRVGPAEPFGAIGQASFRPSLIGGPMVVWQAGTSRSGRLYFADGEAHPVHIMPELIGGMPSLVDDAEGGLHLAFVDTGDPPRLRYTRRSAP